MWTWSAADLKRPPATTVHALRTCINMTKRRLIWLPHSRNNLLRNRVLRSALGHSLPRRQHRLLHHPRRHSQAGGANAPLARQVHCLTCGGTLVALQVVPEYLHDLGIIVLRRYNNPCLQSGDGLLDITLGATVSAQGRGDVKLSPLRRRRRGERACGPPPTQSRRAQQPFPQASPARRTMVLYCLPLLVMPSRP